MSRKAIAFISVMLIALLPGFVFASGGQEGGGEAATDEMSMEDTGPQYGGTFTFFSPVLATDPPSPDIKDGNFHQTQWLSPIQEQLLVGNFEEYGPRGNGEYDFQIFSYVPDKYIRGWLLESWEVQADKIILNVRQGVEWAADNVDYMENREVVAEDIVAKLLYFKDSPAFQVLRDRTGEIYATSKYSVTIELTSFDALVLYRIGYEDRALYSPPEMEEAGPDVWANQVGSGPFMLKEFDVGSHMTYERNPNWWWQAEIDGEMYDVPFVDELRQPIIPDVSTQIAALRTGQIDMLGGEAGVPPEYWESLAASAPELLSKQTPTGAGQVYDFNTQNEPVDDADVRRALMVGTNLKAFADLQGVGELPIHWFPVPPGTPGYYIPMEELPEDIQILYDYDPARAKEMLADAGYPDGLSLELNANNQPKSQDRAALLKDMWEDIGVDVSINVLEQVDFTARNRAGEYEHVTSDGPKVGNPLLVPYNFGRTGNFFNVSNYSNPEFDELIDKVVAFTPEEERIEFHREATKMFLRDVPLIPTNLVVTGHYWWPWVKNYYGERNVGDSGQAGPLVAHSWLDLDLKESMGF